jgi:hypothetical protein
MKSTRFRSMSWFVRTMPLIDYCRGRFTSLSKYEREIFASPRAAERRLGISKASELIQQSMPQFLSAQIHGHATALGPAREGAYSIINRE